MVYYFALCILSVYLSLVMVVGVVSFINGAMVVGEVDSLVRVYVIARRWKIYKKICDCLNRSSISREWGTFLFLITIITFFVCK